MMSRLLTRKAGRAYFACQAITGLVWWILVFTWPLIREATLGALPALWVAAVDLPLFVLASMGAALGVRICVWIVTGWSLVVAACMVGYATVTGFAGWGALAMIAASLASCIAATLILTERVPRELALLGPFRFREAKPASVTRHLLTTALQIVVFWGVFLGVIPCVISWFEERWDMYIGVPTPILVTGVIMGVGASLLGVWAAVSMSVQGRGTPLPAATAATLVIVGPYRYVRNPMAISGIGQGVAVGMMLGSWLVIIYALCGSFVWNWVIRPGEEADLEARFGDAFRNYRDRVGCWVPTLRFQSRAPICEGTPDQARP